MRKIFKIAITELRTLFCSPVAWLILVIFTVQVSMQYTFLIETMLRQQFGRPLWYSIARVLLTDTFGLFDYMLPHLYLYIPLLTMGLMSREYSSGSIKLLYSSPVSNRQIILGKYLSMLCYNMIFVGILFVFIGFTALHVPAFDMPMALVGLLGIYLVICAYAAIGLYMSCLTSYQVVAAVATLGGLAFLNYVGQLGQDIPFVRDITYWLSISGRAGEFFGGLICSEDVLYFMIVIILFLLLAVMKIQSGKHKRSRGVLFARYFGVVFAAIFLGYLTTLPSFKFYYDASAPKTNTLTAMSQEVMSKMDGDLTITTYVNLLEPNYHKGLPGNRNADKKLFEKYIRFKPDMKMDYVYYYADNGNEELNERYPGLTENEMAWKIAEVNELDITMFLPREELKKQIDLSSEEYRFVRQIKRGNGAKTFLRLYDDSRRDPGENEITTAMKRLLVAKIPKVAFVAGHGERNAHKAGDRDYYTFANSLSFRYSLVNSGFDIEEVKLDKEIAKDVDILVIADVHTAWKENELQYLQAYVNQGGNLIIAGEPGKSKLLNPLTAMLGVQFMPGTIVCPTGIYAHDLLICNFSESGVKVIPNYSGMFRQQYGISMPGAAGLTYVEDKGFKVTPVLVTQAKGCWNELDRFDPLSETVTLDSLAGEREQIHSTLLALTRQVGGREQRIVVLGDADCMSNAELLMSRTGMRTANFSLIVGMFQWMSYDEFPLITKRLPIKDKVLDLEKESLPVIRFGLMWVFPCLFVFGGFCVWLKRRRR